MMSTSQALLMHLLFEHHAYAKTGATALGWVQYCIGRQQRCMQLGAAAAAAVHANASRPSSCCLRVQTQLAGEIASFVCDEGASVEYKQPLVEIAPFFGGHIIGDKKHA